MNTKLFFVLGMFGLIVSCQPSDPHCSEGDCIDGYGVRSYEDGGYEKGQWVDGELNGKGEQFFGNTSEFSGDTYVGMFKNGVYHGKGVYRDVSLDFTFDGDFENGAPVGKTISKFDIEKKAAIVSNQFNWMTIENVELGFEIEFPKIEGTSVKEDECTQKIKGFGNIKTTSFNLNSEKTEHVNLAYSLAVLELGSEKLKNYSSTDYENYFNETELALEKLTNSKSIMKNSIDSADSIGRDIWFKNKECNCRVKMRIIIRHGYEYRLSVAIPDKKYSNPHAEYFMDSFKFIDKTVD